MEHSQMEDMAINFRWHQNQPVIDQFPLSEFFHNEVVDSHLAHLVTHYGSPHKAHAASMTAKRVGYAGALMIYARIKHRVPVNPKQCRLITIEDQQTEKTGWLPVFSFPLQQREIDLPPTDWIAKELYTKTLVPIVEVLANEKGISRAVLYENIFVYIKWIFLTKLQGETLFQQLIETPAQEFGVKKRHPIAFYFDGACDKRKTCCLSYQTEGIEKFCKTCPKKF